MIYFLGLGTNIGQLNVNLKTAMLLIHKIKNIQILTVSSFYKTKPWGHKEQADFLNCIIVIESPDNPEFLLNELKNIEKTIGKNILFRWGPRIIDIDILFCDDLIVKNNDLEIPHPRVHERDFVLLPMMEIAPYFVHPVYKKSIIELYETYMENN